jgi:hypothetical protein
MRLLANAALFLYISAWEEYVRGLARICENTVLDQ